MGFADDIMQEFLAAYPEATKGRWSQQELNQKLGSFMQARNEKPLAAFDGLSAKQMHALLNHPFAAGSPIHRINDLPDAVIDQIPFFGLIEVLYSMLSKGPIKLTTKGNLPLSVCAELYERKLLTQDDIEKGYTKKISEDNVAFIQAFPNLDEPVPSTRLSGFFLEPGRVYQWRFVEQFANWFGLIELQQDPEFAFYERQLTLRKSPVFGELFQVNVPGS